MTNTAATAAPATSSELLSLAETVAELHLRTIGGSTDNTIATCGSLGGRIYPASEELLRQVIAAAYSPDLVTHGAEFVDLVLDVFYDCNESIAYCAGIARQRIADRTYLG